MEPIPYNGDIAWLKQRTILAVTHGSHAYGLNTPESDLDIKGVVIPPKKYFLGFNNKFEQAEIKEPDMVIYDIRKFFSLAAECNPNIVEVLWVDPSDYRLRTPLGEKLLDIKDLFLSKKAKHTFSGYAVSQLKRIKTHRYWLTANIQPPPSRTEMGLPEHTVIPKDQLAAAQAAVNHKLATWGLKDMSGLDPAMRQEVMDAVAEMMAELSLTKDSIYLAAGRSIGYSENFLRLLDLERGYHARKVEWEQYQNWKKNRNPKRAALEAKCGYDTKHASHLYRLLVMCREILTTGKVLVKRPDREQIMAIRNGAWTYDQLVEWAERQDVELDEVAKTSTLRHSPDRNFLDDYCAKLVEESFR